MSLLVHLALAPASRSTQEPLAACGDQDTGLGFHPMPGNCAIASSPVCGIFFFFGRPSACGVHRPRTKLQQCQIHCARLGIEPQSQCSQATADPVVPQWELPAWRIEEGNTVQDFESPGALLTMALVLGCCLGSSCACLSPAPPPYKECVGTWSIHWVMGSSSKAPSPSPV